MRFPLHIYLCSYFILASAEERTTKEFWEGKRAWHWIEPTSIEVDFSWFVLFKLGCFGFGQCRVIFLRELGNTKKKHLKSIFKNFNHIHRLYSTLNPICKLLWRKWKMFIIFIKTNLKPLRQSTFNSRNPANLIDLFLIDNHVHLSSMIIITTFFITFSYSKGCICNHLIIPEHVISNRSLFIPEYKRISARYGIYRISIWHACSFDCIRSRCVPLYAACFWREDYQASS